MSLDTELDVLIRQARSAEAPPAVAREQVRQALAQRLRSGGSDPALEEAVLPAPPRGLPRAVTWGVPGVAIGAAALIALQLAPQTADPLVRAPQPPAAVTAPASPAAPALATPEPAAQLAPPQLAPAAAPAHPPPAEHRASPSTRPARVQLRPAGPPRAPAVPPAPAPDLLAESRALARVQQALRDGQSAQALRLLAEQEQEFARGALQEERAAARAMALCGSGQHTAGHGAAAAFATRYPESVLRARVQSSCASREGQE